MAECRQGSSAAQRADLLKSEGFTKRRRVFTRVNDRGDATVVQFRSYSPANLVDL